MPQLKLALLGVAKQPRLPLHLALLDEEIDEHRDLHSEYVRIERLEDVVDGSHRVALEDVRLFLVDGAEEDDRDRPRSLARLDDLSDLESTHVRHLYVEQDRREFHLEHALQRFRA